MMFRNDEVQIINLPIIGPLVMAPNDLLRIPNNLICNLIYFDK